MVLSKLTHIVLLGASVVFLANCSKDHAVLNPNDSSLRKPLFSLSAVTSYEAPMSKRLADGSNSALDMIQASTNPVVMMVWMGDDGRKDTLLCQTSQTFAGWPLRLRVDLYDVPEPSNLELVPGTTNSRIGTAALILVNDANRDGQYKIWDEEVARMVATRDSLERIGLSGAQMQDSINNYGFFKYSKPTQDWWMGTASNATVIYLSDSVALQYAKVNLNPDLGNYTGEDLKIGYNIIALANPRHETRCDSANSCKGVTIADNAARLGNDMDIDIGLIKDWTDFENSEVYVAKVLR